MIVKARFIVPVDSPPVEDGALAIQNGRVAAVGQASEISGQSATDYGDAVIVPGLVNAHTHLELSLLAGRVPPSPDFTDWLKRLIAERREDLESGDATIGSQRDYIERATELGISQSLARGVTAIGDITAFPQATRPVLARSPLTAVSFGEVIAMGKGRDLLQARLCAATDRAEQTERLRIGISPHSPYSVEPSALQACVEHARQENLPLSIHAAETREEEEFTRHGTGPFAEFLAALGLWDEHIPISGSSPVKLLAAVGALGTQTVLAHANYVSDEDIELIAKFRASVVYCPRTHAAFGHPRHRFRDMLAAGINVCLGTDSLASNPDLSILSELRLLRQRHPDFPAESLLALGTICGAKALGLGGEAGSLSPGKPADFCVIALPSAAKSWTQVFECDTGPCAVYIQGGSIPCDPSGRGDPL